MADKIRVGVIGTGFGTIVHVPAFQACPDTEVVAICSTREEHARDAAQQFNIPSWSNDYRELVKRTDIDLISISTPPFEHHPMTMAALDAGKHVLCEKPMAVTVKEAQEMLKKAQDKALVHMLAHEFRWAPARAYLTQLIGEGYIGKLRNVNVTLFTPRRGGSLASPNYTWAAQRSMGGGFSMALGSHYIDAMLPWFGQFEGVSGQLYTHNPERIDPTTGQTKLADADDGFAFYGRFKNGGSVVMSASQAAPFGQGTRIEIYGSEGALVSTQPGFNPPPNGTLQGARVGEPELHDIPIPAEFHPFDDDRDERLLPFRLMVDELVKAIRSRTPVSPSFADGLQTQYVLDGLKDSSDKGRWVSFK